MMESIAKAEDNVPRDFLLDSYNYYLPPELIAQRPEGPRDSSKLLIYYVKENEIIHTNFFNIHKYIDENSLLVLNNSKVIAARIEAKKPSGGNCEIFLLSLNKKKYGYPCLIKTTNKKKINDRYNLKDNHNAFIKARDGEVFYIEFSFENLSDFLSKHGITPLPPYIVRRSDGIDRDNYQTIFSKHYGSVAAPTAGLHFTKDSFLKLKEHNIDWAYITLHVGLGTFKPVKAFDIRDHNIHSENFFIEKQSFDKIESGKKRIAVGTTSLRVLESIGTKGLDFRCDRTYSTDLFIYPGYDINFVDGLLTNFHLPKSTLFILVCTMMGREKTMQLYSEAIKNRYRFYSYGDAMLILK